LDLAGAGGRDQRDYHPDCRKVYGSVGLAALDPGLLGDHWRTGAVGRGKGIGAALDETCRRALVVVRAGRGYGFVRNHDVHQFLAIDHSALYLYPMADPWAGQPSPGRMVLARVDARYDPDLACLDAGLIFQRALFPKSLAGYCRNIHRITEPDLSHQYVRAGRSILNHLYEDQKPAVADPGSCFGGSIGLEHSSVPQPMGSARVAEQA